MSNLRNLRVKVVRGSRGPGAGGARGDEVRLDFLDERSGQRVSVVCGIMGAAVVASAAREAAQPLPHTTVNDLPNAPGGALATQQFWISGSLELPK